jgi:ribosomal-protein-alanine N-acetyltransferase
LTAEATEVRQRAWRSEDAEAIAVMTGDEHIRRWSSMDHDVEGWIARQQSGARGPSLAICLARDDRALGKIALRLPGHASPATTCEAIDSADEPVGELSYWLIPSARGRGLARAAVVTMMESVVAGTSVRSVVLDVECTNTASIRLAEALGAQRREPERMHFDRTGVQRTMIVFVLGVSDHSELTSRG